MKSEKHEAQIVKADYGCVKLEYWNDDHIFAIVNTSYFRVSEFLTNNDTPVELFAEVC